MKNARGHRIGKIIMPSNSHPWPHEFRIAKILSEVGHIVEFIPTTTIKTADILIDGIEFEIKSPLSLKTNSLEHILKKGLRQSENLIFDSSRLKEDMADCKLYHFLIPQSKKKSRLKRLIFITKTGKIIDIK